jgi:hypothetical protein
MKTIIKQLLFASLLLTCGPVSAQEYAIAGRHSDGTGIEENGVLFVGDAGTFRVVNGAQETVLLQSAVWRMEGLDRGDIYIPLLQESAGNIFEFDLDQNNIIMENASILQGFIYKSKNDKSAYFDAKVICTGKTMDNKAINLEFPLLLNFLPGMPEFEVIDYDFTGSEPYIELKYKTIRTEGLELFDVVFTWDGNGDGIIIGLPVQSDNYRHYTHPRYSKYKNTQEFIILYAYNSFGRTRSDTLFVNDLKAKTLIKDFSDTPNFYVYPNPARDYIHLQGEDIQNIKKLAIIDTTGKIRKEISALATDKIDVSELPQGIYILKIEYKNNNKSEQIKLIKN